MNSREAREILAAWIPDRAGGDHPDIQAALDLARTDPELARWWEATQAFHRGAATALRSTPPPADLAERILARRVPVARRPARPDFDRPTPTPWWKALAAAAAAAVLLVAGLWFALRTPPPSEERFDVYRSRMVRAVLREYRMDLVTNDLPAIRRFLARNRAPADFDLLPPLATAPALGAGLLSWQGRPVSMVCLNGGGLGTLFLFVIPADSVKDGAPTSLDFAPVSQLATASWTRDGRTYLLAAAATPEQLRGFLAVTPRAAGPSTPSRPTRSAALAPIRQLPPGAGILGVSSSRPAGPPATSSCVPGASRSPWIPTPEPRRAARPNRA